MPLYELLEKACGTGNGARVLIPELQRPFVWESSKVTLLIDSLIRGWLFGTLLMWKMKENEKQSMPYRGFWSKVYRVEEIEGSEVEIAQDRHP